MDLQQLVDSGALSVRALSANINNLPLTPTRLSEMGLFTAKPIDTTYVLIGIENEKLTLVPAVPRGAPGQPKSLHGKRAKPFMIQHLPQRGTVMADSVQNARSFSIAEAPESGADLQLNSQITGVMEKVTALQEVHRRDNDLTIEWHKMGALNGKILDADGETVLIDIYQEFGFTQETFGVGLANAATNVRNKMLELKRKIEKKLGRVPYRHIHIFASASWFDDFTGHAKVEKAFDRWNEGAALRDDLRRGFTFGGVTIEEVSEAVGEHSFIPDGEAIAFPVGVPDQFNIWYGPADYVETVNTMGLPYYSKSEVMRFGKGIELESQSNPLAMNTRPETVIRLTK